MLIHFELYPCHIVSQLNDREMTMADRSGLKFVGFVFATITLAVIVTAAMVVTSYADGGYTPEISSLVLR